MKRGLYIVVMLMMAMGMKGEEVMNYGLHRVSDINNGAKYVLVRKSKALKPVVAKNKLQSVQIDTTAEVQGNEIYVWEMNYTEGSTDRYLTNSYGKVRYDNDNTLSIVTGVTAASAFNFEWDKTYLTIKKPKSDYYIATSSNEGDEYSLGNADYKSFIVYRVVAKSYKRDLTSQQIGTVCLPFATTATSGAEFYKIAYKEMDGENPTAVYFEQVEGNLEAGVAYVFVPNGESEITFTANLDGQRVKPKAEDKGFKGTFKTIIDGEAGASENVLEGKYMINSSGQFQKCGSNCGLYAYRAYLDMTNVPTQEQVEGPTKKVLKLSGKETPEYMSPTELRRVDGAQCTMHGGRKIIENGRVVILKDGKRYGLEGL